MRPIAHADLLTLWENARHLPVVRRVLLLLESAGDMTGEALLSLSVGRRDDLLLRLREAMFGADFAAVVSCPACQERLEVALTMADVRRAPPADGAVGSSLRIGGCEVHFRLPDSRDLLALTGQHEPEAARQILLRRCVDQATRAGDAIPVAALPPEVSSAIVAAMRRLDPQAEVRIPLECPQCGHAWAELFDIAGYLWDEIHTWAVRTLREVHALASTYGWSEAEILSLSPARRRLYLELVGT